jgi:hypothetical protein
LVHPEQQKVRNKPPSVHDRVSNNNDVCDIINAHKKHKEDGANCGYHPSQGGHYDSEDIHNASFPPLFWQPTNVSKYLGEMNPNVTLQVFSP